MVSVQSIGTIVLKAVKLVNKKNFLSKLIKKKKFISAKSVNFLDHNKFVFCNSSIIIQNVQGTLKYQIISTQFFLQKKKRLDDYKNNSVLKNCEGN